MEPVSTWRSRCLALFRRRKLDEDLDAELRSHIEFACEENMKRGMSAQDARTRALREFGGLTQTKEAYRVQRGLPFLRAVLIDVHYALRQLRKSPAFAATAILTLALGIGGMTAVFSVAEAVLLRPLPFKDPGQLLSLHEWVREDPHDFNVTAPDVLIFQRESKAFSGEGGYIRCRVRCDRRGRALQRGRRTSQCIAVSSAWYRPAVGPHIHPERGRRLSGGDRDQLFALARTISK